MMKKNILTSKGFTLLETLVSTIVFGTVVILTFQMSSEFFKLSTITSSKQEMNTTFIKAYAQMQKDLMITDADYIYSYKTELNNIKTRWCAFPVPIDDNGAVKSEGNTFTWEKIYIYYLNCTNNTCPECPTKHNSVSNLESLKNEAYKYCSDKELIKLIYNNNGSKELYNFSKNMEEIICDNILNYTIPYKTNISLFPNNDSTFKFVDKKIIAKDLFDMDITSKSDNIIIKLSSVRKNDIKKILNYGETDFTQKQNSKYVDQIEFVISSKNS